MNNEFLQKAKDKLITQGLDDFANQVEFSYNYTRNKAVSNRDKHFTMQKRILSVSICVNIANILTALFSSLQVCSHGIAIVTAISSILSIFVTALVTMKDNKSYCETWLRHQAHQAAMEFEIIEYVSGCGNYQSGSSSNNAKAFQNAMLAIWKKNQDNFNTNMAHFNK